MKRITLLAIAFHALVATALPQTNEPHYTLIIRNGKVVDGTGKAGRIADIAISGDRIIGVGDYKSAKADRIIDATGMIVAPGFINMLSWAVESLIADGRSMSDIKQGVTLEIFGEGESMGPLNASMKTERAKQQGDIKYPITWTTLKQYLDSLVAKGVSPNVASFIGAATVRIHELGYADREPTPEELSRMQDLVRQAMREGALGVGAALIYAPAFYAKTPELKALAKAAAEFGGGYVVHMRSEANRLLEALEETIDITKSAGIHGELYHMKASGEKNWSKMSKLLNRINEERSNGTSISANMYTYIAAATGLDAAMPPWVQEGGLDKWVERLKDPKTRAQVINEMKTPSDKWENSLLEAGSPTKVKFIGFKTEKLKPYTGKTLAQVARLRGTSPEDTAIDLVIEDHSRVETVYFLMSEDNVEMGLKQPWVALGSDAESSAPEGVFLKSSTHPRAYGNFARLFARYVRERKALTLEDAVRRVTRLPAENWKLKNRSCFDAGCFADIVIFDADKFQDHATFDKPMQYATGMRDVFVNGVQVLEDGEHTGAKPGRVVTGPGVR